VGFASRSGFLAFGGLLLVGALMGAPSASRADDSVKIYEMRGDTGLLEDFGPGAVCWSPEGYLLVADSHYNVFDLFDTVGRRFRFMKPIRSGSTARYQALAPLEGRQFLVAGDFWQGNHDLRLVSDHSTIQRLTLEGPESWSKDSARDNLSPDQGLRATGFYGDSVQNSLDLQGMACDPATNRVFLGCASPLAADGSVLILEGQLDKLLAKSPDLKFKVVETGLKPEVDASVGAPAYLSDLAYVPGHGLALLLTSQSADGKRFGSNQIWMMKDGSSPAAPVSRGLAPGNRATGMAIRSADGSGFEVALVCDNNFAATKTPSRLVLLQGVQLP
jgi:hypothetical protein